MVIEGVPQGIYKEMMADPIKGPILDQMAYQYLKYSDLDYLTDEFEDELVDGKLKSKKDGSLVRPSEIVTDPQGQSEIIEAVNEELENSGK